MSQELAPVQQVTTLTEQMDFARAVSSGSLLPDSYRSNPANVLIAVGLGAAMGLSPAESLYRISVISGKPTAAAELIASNVRKAGHKLRVKVTENPPSATCTIIRADDPDEPFTVTRDMEWAQKMGLAQKDNYKKQAATMLQWRAISACARQACPEALFGVQHTPDEVDEVPQRARVTVADIAPAPEEVDETPQLEVDGGELMSTPTRRRMFALLTERGITDADEQRRGMSNILDRNVESRASLTEDEARRICDHLVQHVPIPETAAYTLIDDTNGA
jgi:hypothetical protein